MPILKKFRRTLVGVGLASIALAAPALAAPRPGEIATTYANIAQATYEDSLTTAKSLKTAIEALLAKPSDATLTQAREAWKAARVPYQQSEAFRFGNAIVDDWEGRVNAWPLDEGLIDYVADSYGNASDSNKLYRGNVIATVKLTVGNGEIDATKITPQLLAESLHEAGKVEANVATGYHAIEFLLWGQDLNGTEAGAGKRPATDFDVKACTGGNCERRGDYLRAASDLLITDLEEIIAAWTPDGKARAAVMSNDNAGLVALFNGIGSLSFGELAGERMKLGLLLHDPEEEHDCFSDNTFNSHYYDIVGIRNVYLGAYKRIDGSVVTGASAAQLLEAKAPDVAARIAKAVEDTLAKAAAMKQRGESVEAYDQMIGEGNKAGNAVVSAVIEALIAQTKEFERGIAALELKPIEFARSESLDDPSKVLEKTE